jgi:membrane protein YfhO
LNFRRSNAGSSPPLPLRGRAFAAAAAIVAVVSFLPFARGLLAGQAFFFRDLSLHFFPLRRFALDGLRGGELRYWNPYLHEGIPSPFPPVSYPLELFQLLRPDEWGLSVFLALHVCLAAVAFLALARHLGLGAVSAAGGALTYALGGFCLSTLNLYVYVEAMAWAPLVILGTRRAAAGTARDVVLAALATAVAWSTVGTELVLQTILAAVVLSWRPSEPRAALLRVAGGLLLGLGLAAPTTGAMGGVVAVSERARGFAPEVVLAQSIHPLTFLQTVIGDFYGDLSDVANLWWGENFFPRGFPYFLSLYLGAATLAVAAAGARCGRALRVRLVVLTLLAIVVCLGRWGLIGPVVEALPLLRRFRFPTKAFFTVHLAVSLLAALGLDAMEQGRRQAWRWLTVVGLALGSLLAGGLLLPHVAPGFVRYFVAGFFPPDEPWALRERQLAHMLHDAATGGAVALGAAGVALVVLRGRLKPGRAVGAVAALLAADLLRTGAGLNPMVTAGFYRLSPEMTAQLPVLQDGTRLFVCEPVQSRAYWAGRARRLDNHEVWTFETYRETLTPDFNLLSGVPTALSEDLTSLVPVEATPGREAGCDRIGLLVERLRSAVVGHVVSLDPLSDPGLRSRAIVTPSRIAPVTVHVYDVVPPGPGRLSLLDAGGGAVPGGAALARESSDVVEIAVDAAAAAFVVLRDGHAPGWRAWVDGRPTPVTKAEGHYRAVAVTAGRHRLRLVYQPPGLRAGLAAMALSAVIGAVLMLRSRARQASPGPSSGGVG